MGDTAGTKKKKRNFNPIAGLIGFAVTFLAVAAICGFSSGGVIGGAAGGLAVGALIGVMGSGLDTTTHNKEDRERRKQEESVNVPETGDPAADTLIHGVTETLAKLRAASRAANDPGVTGLINDLHEKCAQMLKSVSESPDKAPRMRKFTNYYLPTTLRITDNFAGMKNRDAAGEQPDALRETTLHGLRLVLTAAQKQLDSLHRESMLDLTADIDVLEQMLKRDGFSGFEMPVSPSAGASANGDDPKAQTSSPAPALEEADHGAPVLEFPKTKEKQTVPVNRP